MRLWSRPPIARSVPAVSDDRPDGASAVTTTVEINRATAAEWSSMASEFRDHTIYQTWAYGEHSAAETGSTIERVVLRCASGVIGLAQLRIRRVPFARTGVAYVLRGPLWRRDGVGLEDLKAVLNALRVEYAADRKMLLRLVPQVIAGEEPGPSRAAEECGFEVEADVPPYRTLMIDLSPANDAIRKGFEQKWRNGLNQSERKGLSVRASTDVAAFTEFASLYGEMRTRKQFDSAVTADLFRAVQDDLADDERMTVLLAYRGNELVAGHVSSLLGDTMVYLLGASNDSGRDSKASYLLQWRAIEAAKSAGARWYDLGGIAPETNPGVYRFKAGMGGRDVSFVGQLSAACARRCALVPLAERGYRVVTKRPRRPQEPG